MYVLGLYDEVFEKLHNGERIVDIKRHYDSRLVDDCIYIEQLRRDFKLINSTPIPKKSAEFCKFELLVEAMRLNFSPYLLYQFFPDEKERIEEARDHIQHLKNLSSEIQSFIRKHVEMNRNVRHR